MPDTMRYRHLFKGGYWGPGAFAGFTSVTGGLSMELSIGNRVRFGFNRMQEGKLGHIIRIVGDQLRIKGDDGGVHTCSRKSVIYEPSDSELVARRNAIREQWSLDESRLRDWSHERAELPTAPATLHGGYELI